MYQLEESLLEDLRSVAVVVMEYHANWERGEEKIGTFAMRALARRYLTLREAQSLTIAEVFEWCRYFVFFALRFHPDDMDVSLSSLTIDAWNLLNMREIHSPIE
jgi:hypothetical protein